MPLLKTISIGHTVLFTIVLSSERGEPTSHPQSESAMSNGKRFVAPHCSEHWCVKRVGKVDTVPSSGTPLMFKCLREDFSVGRWHLDT